ncbi:hypothetical protein CKM354_001251100 [Cercospora kikuchii]|uniref:Uncharacterized protein n=1 Tax=Cercospora kikuchii TaxID=84275 RepID=A0A9P3L144_9PEZI|nr:uncharacterized protein CKM354_001251100 [Cercospora kikuchii]GIZ49481.1 hypothetical protein CKM354_001251100 [Cercospora kikuchii]
MSLEPRATSLAIRTQPTVRENIAVMPPNPPSPVLNPTTPTHWLHKSGVQILFDFNAANPPTPDSNGLKPTSIHLHLYIKYRPSIYAIRNNDGVITVPWSWIDPAKWPEAAQHPLSELILDWLTPGIRTASIEAPQFLEFRFDEPLVESVDVYGKQREKEDEGKLDDEGENGGQKRKRDEEEEAGDEGIGSDDGDGSASDESDTDESDESSGESDDESEEDTNDDHGIEDDSNGDGKEDENEPVRDASKQKTVKEKPVEKVLLLAVIMSVSAANRDWVIPGFQKRAWFRDTNPWVLEQILGGQVVERLKQIGAERALTTLSNRNIVRVEILRSLGHLIRISETAQNITHPCVAILEPVSILEEARENTGLMLLNLSPDRMDIIKNSQKIMHADGRVPACIWAVVGWFDRRHPGNGEALLMESEWSMKRFFLENGRNKSAWLQFWHGDPQEFLVEREKLLPEVFRWGLREIMPI